MYTHTFHIPVMGIAFTIDTPIKVAHYGINSAISIIEDDLLERVRKSYSNKYKIPYTPIADQEKDARARRVTSYLNLVKEIVERNLAKFKESCSLQEALHYLHLLPDQSEIKKGFLNLYLNGPEEDIIHFARTHAYPGSIDVNIMTKLDRVNYEKGKPLPKDYNDAHACVRGFASSELQSSLILSAGLNPALYSYLSEFEDFFPNKNGVFKKKIILKVSDYRSAMIQGAFLAKKGLWVSEFRIESGLNCGGHAFATEGYLMGPILEEFKNKRFSLLQSIYPTYQKALIEKGYSSLPEIPAMKITAQGGVGTASEHAFLLDHYELDAVGWGSPFLLVEEATCVDNHTRELIKNAKEEDLYLSGISPLGVPFHNLRQNTKDQEKQQWAADGKPGSPCVKKHLSFNTEFTEKPICTASRKYQNLKIKQLEGLEIKGLAYEKAYQKIIEKACICTGLGTSFLLENKMNTKKRGDGVSICPGPNTAYFDKIVTLKDMVDHIYGRINIISRIDRPHMFMKELGLYLDQLKKLVDDFMDEGTAMTEKKIQSFISNIKDGITYYQNLVSKKLNVSQQDACAFSDFLEFAQTQIATQATRFDLKALSLRMN